MFSMEMDLAHRRSLVRFTTTATAKPDVPSAVPEIGPVSGIPAYRPRAGRRPE